MIEAKNLEKRYGELQAVGGVSFSIEPGEAFGLLGPNGAGKTTSIHMLVGVLAPDAGEVRIEGRLDPTQPEVRKKIGVAPQELAIYEELTGHENIEFFARLYGLSGSKLKERIDWGLEFAGLTDRRNDRSATYSGGMKRRLNLACAVVHEPNILLCDEPTVGVDPQSRNHIFDSIEELRRGGCTLIYTTHYMEEAERLCDRVAIMDHGKVLAENTVEGLIAEHGGSSRIEAVLAQPPADPTALNGTLEGSHLSIETAEPFAAIADLGRQGVEVESLRIDRPDLERVFLNLTGRRLRD